MTKAELVEKLSLQEDFESKAAASRTIEFLIEIITEEVAKGNEVNISGLGKFYSATQAERTGMNPLTGKPFKSPEKQVPKFRASSQFKFALEK